MTPMESLWTSKSMNRNVFVDQSLHDVYSFENESPVMSILLRMSIPHVALLALLSLSAGLVAAPPAAHELAARIDFELDADLLTKLVTPAPEASDVEFLRRTSLDLIGRIPTVSEIHRFLAETRHDKRAVLIDRFIDRPRHTAHLAGIWRDWLLPEIGAIPEARYFQTGFEAWLASKFRSRTGYDQLVRELISVPLPGTKEQAEHVFREPDRPNALAFFAVKDAQPDKLAATATRAFLSIQLECAQCHNHPFAEWQQEQFWNQAAFFAGIERQGNGLFAPLIENPTRRSVSPGEGKPYVAAAFLFGRNGPVDQTRGARVAFADWVTARDNPYFARSAVNRVWALLFGVGLVEPIDDFHDDHPASHPKVLDELAEAFVASDYDLDYVFRTLCLTRAYQRTSAWSDEIPPDPRSFARMLPKGLSAEQFWDSLSLAVGWTHTAGERDGAASEKELGRRRFLEQFAPRSWPAEPETSVSQALSLMNGRLLTRATQLDDCPTLIAVSETPDWSDDERWVALYLATLSRFPTSSERERLQQYFAGDEVNPKTDRYEDIFWVLLNSSEFRLNH